MCCQALASAVLKLKCSMHKAQQEVKRRCSATLTLKRPEELLGTTAGHLLADLSHMLERAPL